VPGVVYFNRRMIYWLEVSPRGLV